MNNFDKVYNNIINEGRDRRRGRAMTLTDMENAAAKIISRGVDPEQAEEVIKAIQDLINEAYNLGINKAMSPGSGGSYGSGGHRPGDSGW